MENASKALFMAGAVLIGILFLTIVSYVFTELSDRASKKTEEMKTHEVAQFNQQFLKYAGRGIRQDDEGKPKNPLTIYDVVTIVNLAIDSNKSNQRPQIKVLVDGSDWTGTDAATNKKNLLQEIQNNMEKKYKCEDAGVEIDPNTLWVNKVTIKTLN